MATDEDNEEYYGYNKQRCGIHEACKRQAERVKELERMNRELLKRFEGYQEALRKATSEAGKLGTVLEELEVHINGAP